MGYRTRTQQAGAFVYPIFAMLALLAWMPTPSYAGGFPEGQWVDLSHDFADDTLYWPTADKFAKSTVFEGETDKGYFYSAYNVAGAEHGGTHVDAPVHFARDHISVDKIPVEQLIGPGIVIRVANQVGQNNKKDRNYLITIADIQAFVRMKAHTIVAISVAQNSTPIERMLRSLFG